MALSKLLSFFFFFFGKEQEKQCATVFILVEGVIAVGQRTEDSSMILDDHTRNEITGW